jgi:uncharacterized protein DUF6766
VATPTTRGLAAVGLAATGVRLGYLAVILLGIGYVVALGLMAGDRAPLRVLPRQRAQPGVRRALPRHPRRPSLAGVADLNARQVTEGLLPVSLLDYVTSSSFGVDVMENWQPEYLQFFLYVFATVRLVQRGSSES